VSVKRAAIATLSLEEQQLQQQWLRERHMVLFVLSWW